MVNKVTAEQYLPISIFSYFNLDNHSVRRVNTDGNVTAVAKGELFDMHFNYFDFINGNDINEIFTLNSLTDLQYSSMLLIRYVEQNSDYGHGYMGDKESDENIFTTETYPNALTTGTFVYHARRIQFLVSILRGARK